MTAINIKERVNFLKEEITALKKEQSIKTNITVCVATKYANTTETLALYDAGCRTFGENRLQEALEKIKALKHLNDINWHFIGRIQSNKIKKIVDNFSVIQSVDSLDKFEKINTYCVEQEKNVIVYAQVNIGNDPNKRGFSEQQMQEMASQIFSFSNIQIQGIMVILPLTENKNEIISLFNKAYTLFQSLKESYEISELSMGMSGDYKEAIQCGATTIRVGRLLFK